MWKVFAFVLSLLFNDAINVETTWRRTFYITKVGAEPNVLKKITFCNHVTYKY